MTTTFFLAPATKNSNIFSFSWSKCQSNGVFFGAKNQTMGMNVQILNES